MLGPRSRDEQFSAFARDAYADLLRAAHLLCGGDREEAEDLVQTSLLKTYLAWGRLRDPSKARAYVRTVMARTLITRHRRAWVNEVSVEEVPEPDPDQQSYEQVDDRLDLTVALAHMLPRRNWSRGLWRG